MTLFWFKFNPNSSLTTDEMKINIVPFPTNIPTSEILENKDTITVNLHGIEDFDAHTYDLKKKAHNLYCRYIANGSEFEINISWKQRLAVKNVIGNLDILLTVNMMNKDLILLFDALKDEMRMLLDFALARFKITPEWKQIDIQNLMDNRRSGMCKSI